MTDIQVLAIVLILFALNINIWIAGGAITHAIKDLKKKDDKNDVKKED